jgi:uncharacterized protein YqgV (UPF0045/DUF77 family)
VFIGCQFSLYAMSDDFVDTILAAVRDLRDRDDLRVEADDLSTLIVGPSETMFEAVREAFVAAANTGTHVVASLTFSRGCPGEPDDPICTPEGPEKRRSELPDPRTVATSGVRTAAQFAVYPLGAAGYMDTIGEQIERAKQAGTFSKGKHFCTRLDGDAAAVFATIEAAFEAAGEQVGHVVTTATVSANSPSDG